MSTTQTITAPVAARRVHRDNAASVSLETLHDQSQGQTIDQDAIQQQWDTKDGWPVVIAGASMFFVYLGLVYSYGIVQLHL
jgi:hypothetical protein